VLGAGAWWWVTWPERTWQSFLSSIKPAAGPLRTNWIDLKSSNKLTEVIIIDALDQLSAAEDGEAVHWERLIVEAFHPVPRRLPDFLTGRRVYRREERPFEPDGWSHPEANALHNPATTFTETYTNESDNERFSPAEYWREEMRTAESLRNEARTVSDIIWGRQSFSFLISMFRRW
jgi:hypothetical protein